MTWYPRTGYAAGHRARVLALSVCRTLREAGSGAGRMRRARGGERGSGHLAAGRQLAPQRAPLLAQLRALHSLFHLRRLHPCANAAVALSGPQQAYRLDARTPGPQPATPGVSTTWSAAPSYASPARTRPTGQLMRRRSRGAPPAAPAAPPRARRRARAAARPARAAVRPGPRRAPPAPVLASQQRGQLGGRLGVPLHRQRGHAAACAASSIGIGA